MKQPTTIAKIFDKNMQVIETIRVNVRRSRQEQTDDIRKKYKNRAFAFQIVRPDGPDNTVLI